MTARTTALLEEKRLVSSSRSDKERARSPGVLRALAMRPVSSPNASENAPDDILLRLMRQVMVARVAASDNVLSLAITNQGERGASAAGAMIIASADEALASLNLVSGDLVVWVLGEDASAIAATGWGRPATSQGNPSTEVWPREMLVDAAASPEDVLVLSQIVEAAIVRATR